MASNNDYVTKYKKLNYKQIKFELSRINDKDIIAFLDSKANKRMYLKELIRKDMAEIKATKKDL